MAAYPKTGRSPEALVNMLITVIEKTPGGGATLEDVREAYRYAKETEPTDRTIYRNIRRINELFYPHLENGKKAKGKGPRAGDASASSTKAIPLTIKSERDNAGIMRYKYNGRLAVSSAESSQALMIILGLYSQQKGILKGHFEKVIASLLQEMLSKKDWDSSFFGDIDEHIYVSGHGPLDSMKLSRRISEIVRAIDNCRRIKIEYTRTYDGVVRNREVEPYGLVCRHGNWYLVGRCLWQDKRRIYQLDQVKRLEVIENSTFTRPQGISMSDIFKDAWGIWNIDEDHKAKVEKVRLVVKKGVAERFGVVSFHGSQQVKSLPDGEVEVTFMIAGAGEMIPWMMSWGPTLVVIEPEWLKDELKNNLQSTLQLYSN